MSIRPPRNGKGWTVDIGTAAIPRWRRNVSAALSRRQVEALEREWRGLLERGILPGRDDRGGDVAPALATWTELANAWWDQVGLHQSWAVSLKGHLNRLADSLGDGRRLEELGTVDFAAAVARWRSEPVVVPYRKRLADGTEGKRWIRRLPPNSPTTINTRLRVAQGIWSWGTDVQGLALPRILWKRLRLEEPDRDPLALHVPPALREAVMAAAAPHVRIALLIAEETGLRIGSVLALRWERIDLEAARYSITVKSRRPGGRVVVKPITPALRAILEEAAGLDHDEKRDGPQRPTRKEIGAVVSYNGVAVRSIKKGVQAARRRAGLPSFLAKNLRHSTAIEILAAGGTITDAQAALDHTDPGVTHKHYGRLDVDRVRQAMERRTLAAKKRG